MLSCPLSLWERVRGPPCHAQRGGRLSSNQHMAGTTWRIVATKPRQRTVIQENINIARLGSHPSGPYLSEDFYAALMTGKLARYDAYDETRADFNRWKGTSGSWSHSPTTSMCHPT
jgi:hypothetical protein